MLSRRSPLILTPLPLLTAGPLAPPSPPATSPPPPCPTSPAGARRRPARPRASEGPLPAGGWRREAYVHLRFLH
jgi:hypothetical protein